MKIFKEIEAAIQQNNFGYADEFESYAKVFGRNDKIAYVYRDHIRLQDADHNYSDKMRILTPEEIQSAHLGTVKVKISYRGINEMVEILKKYFA